MVTRRHVLTTLCAAGGLAAVHPALRAQGKPAYPERAVRLIVPYAPGGGTDSMARVLGQKLSEIWNQKVIVENRPGASESIAASAVARSPADGYTLLFASDSTFQLNPLLYNTLSYRPDADLLPVTRFASAPFALFVNAKSPVNTFDEFIAYARERRGKVFFGSYGISNSTHLGLAWISKKFDLGMEGIAFAGQSPAMMAVLAGDCDIMFANIIPSSVGFIEKGDLKILVTSGETRQPAAPDVPTFRELGHTDLDTSYTLGLAAPAGTPVEIQNRIVQSVEQAVRDPKVVAHARDALAINLFSETPEQYRRFIDASRATLKQRIDAAGIGKLD